MAFDTFLKVEGIPGESKDHAHKDWIEVLSFSHHITQRPSGAASTAGGAGAERCDHGPFTIVKALDKASPKLAEACCGGDHIKNVTLSLNRAGGDKLQYMEYKLSDAMITSVSPGGAAQGSETLPLEEVSFVYAKIEWKYTQQKRSDGAGGGQVATGWDVEANRKI